MITAIFLFVGLLVCAVIFTYIVISLINSSTKGTNPTMDALLQTNIALVSTSTADFAADLLSIVTGKSMLFVSGLPSQTLNLIRFGIVVVFALAFHEGYHYFLSGGDIFFRVLLGPLFEHVFLNFFQILRLMYGAIMPFVNYFYTATGQLTSGTVAIAVKCQLSSSVNIITFAVKTIMSFLDSMQDFIGDDAFDNTVLTNELNLTSTIINAQKIITSQENVASCVCDGLTPAFEMAFAFLKTPHIGRLTTNLFNIVLSIIQEVIQIFPPFKKVPLFTRTFYYIGASFYEIGRYTDVMLVALIETIFRNFFPKFQLRGVPKEFWFASIAHVSVAIFELFHVIVRSAVVCILNREEDITNPKYMTDVMDMGKVFHHIDLFVYNFLNIAHWLILLVTKSTSGAVMNSINEETNYVLEGIPEHVQMDCYLTTEETSINLPCGIYHIASVPINFLYLLIKEITEIAWYSSIAGGANTWYILQKYDGMQMDRSTKYSCEFRRDYMTWDKTLNDCICEKPNYNFPLNVTSINPLNLNTDYRPFCGQPTMQANVWGNLDMGLDMLSKVFLAEIFVIPAKAIINLITEGIRLILRTIFALGTIKDSNYFSIPINCGWGTGDFAECRNRTHGKSDYCVEENGPGCTCNPMLELPLNSSCECIFNYPDTEQEVAQGAYNNYVLDKFYSPEAQAHWCGSFHFERLFKTTDELALAVDNVLSIFSISFATESDYCDSMSYEIGSSDTLKYTKSEWNYVILETGYTENSCTVHGNLDMFCGISMTLQKVTYTLTQQLRAIIMTSIGIFTANIDLQKFKLDISERLCDAERVLAAATSVVGVIFVPIGMDARKSASELFYVLSKIVILPFEIVNIALVFISDLINNPTSIMSDASIDLIDNIIRLTLDWYIEILRALGGGFFMLLADILTEIRKFLSKTIWDLIILTVKVTVGLFNFIANGKISDTFLEDIGDLLEAYVKVVIQLAENIWDLILESGILDDILGIVEGIVDFADTICDAIAGIVPGMSCNLQLRGHRNFFASNRNTTMSIANSMLWNGNSRCDLLVHRYKNYDWNELRPIEQIEIYECVEQHRLGFIIGEKTGLPIPHDIVYNWKRKYLLGFDISLATWFYFEHLFGITTSLEMMEKMKHRKVRLDIYIPALQKMRFLIKSHVTLSNIDGFIRDVFSASNKINEKNSTVSSMYRIYDEFGKMANNVQPHVNRLIPSYHELADNISSYSAKPVLSEHVKRLRTSLDNFPKVFKTYNMKSFIPPLGVAGTDATITPCSQREGSYTCINCVFVDNFINVHLREAASIMKYMNTVYIPITVPQYISFMENEDRKVRTYREKIAPSLDSQYEIIPKNASQTLTVGQLALKDWEHLFSEWEIRNDLNLIDIFSRFLNTVDDKYVPFFGHGLGYIISYPFIEGCPSELIHCQKSITSERVALISEQWLYQLSFWAGMYGLQTLTGVPVFNMLSVFPFNGLFTVGIYLFIVYGMVFTCMPSLPNCLVDDFYVWLYDVAYPSCFCEYYPGLSNSCDPETCFLSDKVTTFKSCADTVPLYNYDNMGYFWAPVFWFRTQFPDAFLWLFKTAPFSYLFQSFEGVKDIAIRLQDGIEITQYEIDCMTVGYSDLILIFIGFYLISFLLSALIPIVIKSIIHFLKIVIIFLNTVYIFGVATELSTLPEED